MAEFEEVINLKYKETGDPAKSVKSIKTELREAQQEALTLARQFGDFSPQATAAAKKVANLRDEVGDFNQRVAALNPDRFQAFGKVTAGIAGGFAAAQGAMALFGNESENVQKALLKVQGAMALSQGIQQVLDMKNSLGSLVTQLTGPVVAAFKSVAGAARLVGMALGLGIIISGVALLVGYWEDIKELISGVSKEQTDLLETTKETVKKEEEKLEALSGQENVLKLQGLSEREILNLKIQQTDETIAALQAQVLIQDEITKKQVEAAERNKRILKGILEFISAPILLLLRAVDAAGNALGKNFGLAEGFSNSIAELLFDPEDIQKKGDEAIIAIGATIDKLKNQRAGYLLTIKGMDKKANDDAIAEAKKQAEALLSIEADLAKRLKKSKEDARKSPVGKEIEIEDEKNRILAEKAEKARQERLSRDIAWNEEANQIRDKNEAEQLEATKKAEEAKLAVKKAAFEATYSILNSLSELFGRQTAAGKAFALSQIAIDSAVAIGGAVRNAQVLPFPGNLVAMATGIAAVLANIARAKAILNGGGPNSGTGNQQQSSFNIPLPSSFTPGSDRLRRLPDNNKVFVTEYDISNTQNRVSRNRQISVV